VFITSVENFVLFSSVFALTAFIVAFTLRQVIVRGLWLPRANSVARIYGLAVVLPPVASLWLVAAAFLPRFWLTPEEFAAAHSAQDHQFHLLGEMTIALQPFLGYAMAAFVVVIAIFAICSNAYGSWRVGRVIKQLELQAAAPPPKQVALVNEVARKAGLSVGLVMSDYPLSFVWGFRHSKLILSSGLLRTLNAAELTGVLEHETAHHARRDNLIKLLLSLCSYSSLAFPLSRLIVGWRAAEVEMICDEVAAARTSEPLEIAEALVKLRRQTMSGHASSELAPTAAMGSSFVSNSALVFQRRVGRLLTLVDAPVSELSHESKSPVARGAWLFTSSLITMSAILLFDPLFVHHAAEALIGIFK
jgi:Zn-dependent protease with chaperone function